MKFLRRAYFALLYTLPAVLFFSYYPIIRLGSSDSMNFELSLPLIWLVIFDIIAFMVMIGCGGGWHALLRTSGGHGRGRGAQHPQRRADATPFLKEHGIPPLHTITNRKFFLFSLFPFYATISILWSANATRALLTAGIIWLLFFAVFAILYITPLLSPAKTFRHTLLKTFFISSAVICVICWLQAILDVFGVSRECTLLCPGCISQTFGFPHPSGFAIEPQFMGNLLLAPTLLSLWMLIQQPLQNLASDMASARVASEVSSREERAATTERVPRKDGRANGTPKMSKRALTALAALYSSTLFLTFSRGAIYAFAVGLVVLLIFALVRHQFRPAIIAVQIFAFIFTLTMQGIFNVVGPTHGSFISGVTKSIHQLSLGIIDFRPQTPVQDTTSAPDDATSSSTFDGYIAESTDIRLNLNAAALKTWFAAPGADLRTKRFGHNCPNDGSWFNDTCESYTIVKYNRHSILFGVGLGGAGTALYKNRAVTGITSPKEIVQNQPLSLLLELGLVGIAFIIFSLLLAFCPRIFPRQFVDGYYTSIQPTPSFWQHPAMPLLLSLIIAYVITLQFFSGLPNALHIYLLPPLLYFALAQPILTKHEKPIALSK